MNGIAQIDATQNSINKGLQQRNKHFKADNSRVKQQRHSPHNTQPDNKAGNNLQHNVPDSHIGNQTNRQTERFR